MKDRTRQPKKSGNTSLWFMTYADMSMLLLTFFVLIFSMSSMDSSIIARISLGNSAYPFPAPLGGPGALSRLRDVESAIKGEGPIKHNLAEIKELLFPEGDHPLEIPRQEFLDSVDVVDHEEGVVIVLSGGIFFENGSANLASGVRQLVAGLSPVVQHMAVDVNVSGHAAIFEGNIQQKDTLSAHRAMTVLEIFLGDGLEPRRFSLSGYGSDRPNPNGLGYEVKNKRVEILFKVNKRMGRYA